MNLTPQQSTQIKELVSLCLEVELNTPHNVFFEYKGYIDSIGIEVWKNGYTEEKDEKGLWKNYLIPLDNLEMIAIVKAVLEDLLNNN